MKDPFKKTPKRETRHVRGKYLAAEIEGFNVLAGSASIHLAGLVLGATGGVVSLGNAFPHKRCELYDLYQ